MINSHQFQQAAKQFRAGRISLKEFTDLVISNAPARKPHEEPGKEPGNGPGNGPAQPVASAERQESARAEPSQLPQRPRDSHKGDFGRIVAIGGSQGMAGAIGLTGLAALRSGSGLVKVAVPDRIQDSVALLSPCLMTIGCPDDAGFFHRSAENLLQSYTTWADVVALGPGLGRHESLAEIIKSLYSAIPQPMIVDADALNVLAEAGIDLSEHAGQRILTPHPGEFQRLSSSKLTSRVEMEQVAKQLAGTANVIIVLKGSRTYVTDGSRDYHNRSGNPGMATAGAGDVLTGVIASLVGQGMSAFEASELGVYLHGVAGDFAAESIGETSLIATDIIDCLPAAFKQHANRRGAAIGFLSN